jgi:hypothetical protein
MKCTLKLDYVAIMCCGKFTLPLAASTAVHNQNAFTKTVVTLRDDAVPSNRSNRVPDNCLKCYNASAICRVRACLCTAEAQGRFKCSRHATSLPEREWVVCP